MIINAVSYKWNEKTYTDNERNELRRMALDLLKVRTKLNMNNICLIIKQ